MQEQGPNYLCIKGELDTAINIPYSRQQKILLVLFSFANLSCGICHSLMAPFFPLQATMKGVSPTQYGFVFSAFELTIVIVSPFYGKYFPQIGAKFLLKSGILVAAATSILFGFLLYSPPGNPFFYLSVAIRVVEGAGIAAWLVAIFAIVTMEFPTKIATVVGFLETFYGFGLIIGPTIGGGLFMIGGFVTPFVALGGTFFLIGCLIFFLLPEKLNDNPIEKESSLNLLKIKVLYLDAISVMAGSLNIVFLEATLEVHLSQFDLNPISLGAMFLISGGMYAITAPIWGYLVDKVGNPKIFILISSILVTLSFLFIGPAPFLPLKTNLWLVGVALFINGTGNAGLIILPFIDALQEAVKHGFPDNSSTYAMMSSMWSSTYSMGAFVGPFIGGILLDHMGFRIGTIVPFVICVSLVISLSLTLIFEEKKKMNTDEEEKLCCEKESL